MNLRDRFKNSRRARARDITVQGIGDFKILIPSAARVTEIRAQSSKINGESEDMTPFVGLIVAQHVVDENFERVYSDEEVDTLLADLDPFALFRIYGLILSKESPDETTKNSEPTPSADSPSV